MHAFQPFYIAHIFCLFVLIGVVFASIANPVPEMRKPMLNWSGIAAVLVLVAGFGMKGMLHIDWPLWIWVKIVCWFVIAALVGPIFRRPQEQRKMLSVLLGAVLVALIMVYYQPA